ncbi:Exportin-1 [Choanephora cucurbitarum]|uniref:Exportin-1 n=1 Tax=Choanephora cucurbitarum TaxID=101091 RepID=A0A1C7NBU7_9FUNG|nr:Exportin-1 [Choanephora cucurbitarum]
MSSHATFNVAELDSLVHSFYEGTSQAERKKAQDLLTEFQQDPNAWQLVDRILEQSSSLQTKFIALGILEEFIKVRWNTLPVEQRLVIRDFVVKTTIDISSNESTLRSETVYLNKLDLVLVQILKKDWPHYWPTFIQEIVDSSAISPSLCENNMKILQYLSEEVFDFSADHMTFTKMTKLKNQMVNEFGSVFDLCKKVLSTPSTSMVVLTATLETLHRFISWIPIQFIYRQDLIQILEFKQAASATQRNLALQCFTEIVGLSAVDIQQYSDIILHIYSIVYTEVKQLKSSHMLTADYASLDTQDQHYIEIMAIFLTTVMGKYRLLIESTEGVETVHEVLDCLLCMSRIPEQEIWKICLEYWGIFVYDIVQDSNHGQSSPYQSILQQLSLIMVDNMVQPDDILIIQHDDDDEIQREFIRQSDTTALSQSMRHVFSLLTSLDPISIHNMIRSQLQQLPLDQPNWSWNHLFRICWAIGSISGAVSEQQENEFLETVLDDLVQLLQRQTTEDQEWVVASCLLSIAGQYPHFLKSHWDFTSFLLQRIVGYMQYEQSSVRDMACDTFLKICQCCKRELVVPHRLANGQPESDILTSSLNALKTMVARSDDHQMCMVFEAIGTLISTLEDSALQHSSIQSLMLFPNTILKQAQQTGSFHQMSQAIRLNISVCKPVGPIFKRQIQTILLDLTTCYQLASQAIHQQEQPNQQTVLFRRVRKLILELLETFFCSNERIDMQDQTILAGLITVILKDYQQARQPEARESDVLSLLTSYFEKIQDPIWPDLLQETIQIEFVSTLPMINTNFSDYPEFRHEFYRLLRVLNRRCFLNLFQSPQLFQLVIDSIMWGTKHTVREIAQMALQTCLDMINTVAELEDEDVSSQFFETFYVRILTDILEILVDPDCRHGFNYQSQVLSRLLELVQEGGIYTRLFNPAEVSNPLMSNVEYLQQYVLNLLCNAFPLLQKDQIEVLVMGMFEYSGDLQRFQNDIRDFLIDIREVSEASVGEKRAQEEMNAELELLRQL